MLELYIIRHGIAGSSIEDEIADNKRPLEKKGKRIMKDVAKGLKKLKISFDIVLSCPFFYRVRPCVWSNTLIILSFFRINEPIRQQFYSIIEESPY